MNRYKEKKQSRIIYYKRLAAKMESQSEALRKRSDELSKAFEGGQPILIGHHSEKRARRLQESMHRKMQKSLELQEKAEHFKQRAKNVANSTAISSDDPEAMQKINEKLLLLKNKHEAMKKVNRVCRSKKHTNEKKLKLLTEMGIEKQEAIKLIASGGYEDFEIRNSNRSIHAAQQRIDQLQKLEAIPESYEVVNEVAVHVDKELNRVRLIFPGIPDAATRTTLKKGGFVWSPSSGSWQRKITAAAIQQGKDIARQYNG